MKYLEYYFLKKISLLFKDDYFSLFLFFSERLKCTRGVGTCDRAMILGRYSRPILLQHFPMYRESDAECTGIDSAPQEEKNIKFRQRWECISEESSQEVRYFIAELYYTDYNTR